MITGKEKVYLTQLAAKGTATLVEQTKKHNSVAKVFYLQTNDRGVTRRLVQNALKKDKILYRQYKTNMSSEDITEFSLGPQGYRFVYKPKSGGMTETTLNATITELVPCLMYLNGIKDTKIDTIYQKISKLNQSQQKCYLTTAEAKAGEDFIALMPDSSLYSMKMSNAIAINRFLLDITKKQRVKNVYWTYRKKPDGVPANSPADIVIEFMPSKFLGVSLKAGSSSSAEPLLNTYVNPIYTYFNSSSEAKTRLRATLWKNVYSKIPGLKEIGYDTTTKGATLDILREFEKNYLTDYEKLYDTGLTIIRNAVGFTMTKDLNLFRKYCRTQILKQSEVPVMIIKAINDTYTEVKDGNQLNVLLAQVTNVIAKPSTSSKQNFNLCLYEGTSLIGEMKMSVRTNKVGVEHKLGQFYNLAVKYNGLEK